MKYGFVFYYLENAMVCDKEFFDEICKKYIELILALDCAIREAIRRGESSIPIYLDPMLSPIVKDWDEVLDFFDGNGLHYDYRKDGRVCRIYFNS